MHEPVVIEVSPRTRTPLTPEQAFVETLYRATPRVFVAYGLVAACVGVFLLMALRGVSVFTPTTVQLQAWGASFPPLTTNGQWWRLVTSLFVHVGLVHLAVNMYGLYNLGPLIERLFGNVGFLILYLLSGICGGLASLLFSGGATTAGASGAIFGLFGGLLAFMVGQRGAVPPRILAVIRNNAISVGVINVGIAFVIPNLDHAAHLGGVAGGLICGLILRKRFSPDFARGRWWRNLLCAVLLPGSVGVVFLLLSTGDPARAQSVVQTRLTARRAFDQIDAAGDTDEAEGRLEREVLVPWRAARERLNAMSRWPFQGQHDLDAWKNYFRRNEESFEQYGEALRKNDPAARQRAKGKLHASEVEWEFN